MFNVYSYILKDSPVSIIHAHRAKAKGKPCAKWNGVGLWAARVLCLHSQTIFSRRHEMHMCVCMCVCAWDFHVHTCFSLCVCTKGRRRTVRTSTDYKIQSGGESIQGAPRTHSSGPCFRRFHSDIQLKHHLQLTRFAMETVDHTRASWWWRKRRPPRMCTHSWMDEARMVCLHSIKFKNKFRADDPESVYNK